MIEGMYTAAAGMAAQQARLDAVANDLANANTTAYKSNRVAFRDLLYQKPGLGAGDGVMIGSGSAATSLGRNMTAGSIQQTQRPLDVALQGPGFLQVTGLNGKPALTPRRSQIPRNLACLSVVRSVKQGDIRHDERPFPAWSASSAP